VQFTIVSRTGQQHEYELPKLLKRRPVGDFEIVDAGNKKYRIYGKSGTLVNHLADISLKGDNAIVEWRSGSQYQMIAKAFKYFVDTGKQPNKTNTNTLHSSTDKTEGVYVLQHKPTPPRKVHQPIGPGRRQLLIDHTKILGQKRLKKLTELELKSVGKIFLDKISDKHIQEEILDYWYKEWKSQYNSMFDRYMTRQERAPTAYYMATRLLNSDPVYFSYIVKNLGYEDLWLKAATLYTIDADYFKKGK